MAGVAQDATRLVYLPATDAQWTQARAVAGDSAGNPSAIWLFQEASGSAADVLGNFNLTKSGTFAYQQAVADMATKGIMTTAGVAGAMISTSASLPDIATTSCALLMYVAMPASVAGTRALGQLGQPFGSTASAQLVPSKKLNYALDPNTATGGEDPTTVTRPIWITVDRTNNAGTLCSDLENLTATLTATPSSKEVMVGGDNVMSFFPDTCTYTYGALFVGAAAERTLAQRRALLTTLGWSIPW